MPRWAMKNPISRPAPSSASGPLDDPAIFPIVAIGASAGGLEASKKLVGALPADTGMAFVLVQHLDPTHLWRLIGTIWVDRLAMRNEVRSRLIWNGA